MLLISYSKTDTTPYHTFSAYFTSNSTVLTKHSDSHGEIRYRSIPPAEYKYPILSISNDSIYCKRGLKSNRAQISIMHSKAYSRFSSASGYREFKWMHLLAPHPYQIRALGNQSRLPSETDGQMLGLALC